MGRRRRRETTLPAPYLRRVWLDRLLVEDWEAYPFCLPIFRDEFDLSFDSAITIIVGENGSGKSTIAKGSPGSHYRVMREFCADPRGFVEAALAE